MTPARMVELLDGQAATIARLTAELAAAEAEADDLGREVANRTTDLVEALDDNDRLTAELDRWAWIARWIEDNACAVPGAIDIALEAWSDMRDKEQGNNT